MRAHAYHARRRWQTQIGVSPDYMSRQQDINERMRSILNDWLVEVCVCVLVRASRVCGFVVRSVRACE